MFIQGTRQSQDVEEGRGLGALKALAGCWSLEDQRSLFSVFILVG